MTPLQVTFGGSCSPQVVDGSQDEPAGLLLIGGNAQHLHGRLQLTELLSCLLLLLRLQGQMGTLVSDFRGTVPPSMSPCCWTLREGRTWVQPPKGYYIIIETPQGPGLPSSPYCPLTLANGMIPNTVFSAKWFKWSSVLGVQMRHKQGA